MFGLKDTQIEKMNACFALHSGIERVIVYGSRAMGNYRDGSDIDLTIEGLVDSQSMSRLETQLDDLLLPYFIDLSLKHKITHTDLISHIDSMGKVFYQKVSEPMVSK
jgi:uncharacterized protein